jgi:hypothetical protein
MAIWLISRALSGQSLVAFSRPLTSTSSVLYAFIFEFSSDSLRRNASSSCRPLGGGPSLWLYLADSHDRCLCVDFRRGESRAGAGTRRRDGWVKLRTNGARRAYGRAWVCMIDALATSTMRASTLKSYLRLLIRRPHPSERMRIETRSKPLIEAGS